MADKPVASEPAPRIFEAERVSGPSGGVMRGKELTEDEAIQRRKSGLDTVVCGTHTEANRKLARDVEAAIGVPTRPMPPETKAGPFALPHFHQVSRDPEGHGFYETENKKARKKP